MSWCLKTNRIPVYKTIRPHLDVRTRVDLMHGVSGGTSSLSIQVVALHKDSVVAEAAHPHITFALTLQLDALTNVQSRKKKFVLNLCYLLLRSKQRIYIFQCGRTNLICTTWMMTMTLILVINCTSLPITKSHPQLTNKFRTNYEQVRYVFKSDKVPTLPLCDQKP